jgi:hypothetical protein
MPDTPRKPEAGYLKFPGITCRPQAIMEYCRKNRSWHGYFGVEVHMKIEITGVHPVLKVLVGIFLVVSALASLCTCAQYFGYGLHMVIDWFQKI